MMAPVFRVSWVLPSSGRVDDRNDEADEGNDDGLQDRPGPQYVVSVDSPS